MTLLTIILAAALQVLPLPSHPRLFLLEGEEKALMRNVGSDGRWSRVHDAIVQEAERIAEAPSMDFKLNARKEMHQKGCECVRRMMFLAYSYRTTGKEAFLRAAERLALDICALPSWNPYHFLDVAEITFASAIAYDWLYKVLDPETRSLLAASIREKALITSETGGEGNPAYNLRWMDMTANWSQICHGSLAIAALAIYENDPELCERIIERTVYKLHIPMEAEYIPDGAYSQGIGYWGYGTALNVMFLDAMEKCRGEESVAELEAIPGFMKTGKYFCQLLTNTQRSFSFCDNSTGDNLPEHCIFWFYSKTKDATLLYPQKPMIDRWVGTPEFVSGSYARHDPLMVIWGAGTGETPTADFNKAEQPEELFYIARGMNPICTMRSGWTQDDIWLGFKAGNPSCAHGHMDVGEFMLEWGGVRWAEDLGSDGYSSFVGLGKGSLFNMAPDALRWNELLRYNNFSHNTLTVNGRFQNLETKAEFTDSGNSPDGMYTIADLTNTYAGQLESAIRKVSLKDGRKVLIEDELKATGSRGASVVWNMTTRAEEFDFDPASRIISLAGINEEGSRKVLKMRVSLSGRAASPGGFSVKRLKVNDEFNYPKLEKPADGCWFIRIRYNIKKGMSQHMTVEILPEM
jgi:hypothetical protein